MMAKAQGLRVMIFEVLIAKANVPDKAGNVYTRKALRELADQVRSKRTSVMTDVRIDEKPNGQDELRVRYETGPALRN